MKLGVIFLIVGLLWVPAIAADALLIPGTHITQTADDVACDDAMDRKDLKQMRDSCNSAAAEYAVMAAAREGDPASLLEQQEVRFYGALCLYQVALAYQGLSDEKNAHDYARQAYDVNHVIDLQYRAKLNSILGRPATDANFVDREALAPDVRKKTDAAFGGDELNLIRGFTGLKRQLFKMFPDLDPDNG